VILKIGRCASWKDMTWFAGQKMDQRPILEKAGPQMLFVSPSQTFLRKSPFLEHGTEGKIKKIFIIKKKKKKSARVLSPLLFSPPPLLWCNLNKTNTLQNKKQFSLFFFFTAHNFLFQFVVSPLLFFSLLPYIL
jgi:hypothetical protein